MRLRQHLLLAVLLWSLGVTARANPWNGKVVLQAFWWNYWNNNYPNDWATYLADLAPRLRAMGIDAVWIRSEEHTSELQSLTNLVCRLLLEKKKTTKQK